MNEDPAVQFLSARQQSRKRTHREISGSHSRSRSQSPWEQHGESSSSAGSSQAFNSQRPRLPPLSSLPQRRYPRDGYDFRRPVMSTGVPPPPSFPTARGSNVIDLTEEPDPLQSRRASAHDEGRANRASRAPRFGRDIMADVVDLEDDQSNSSTGQQSSPEVQFLGSAVRRGLGEGVADRHARAHNANVSTLSMRGANLMSILRGMHRPEEPSSNNREDILREEVALRTRNIARAFRHAMEPFWPGESPRDGLDLTIDMDNDLPVQLDYSSTGFYQPAASRPTQTYVPPPAALEGFTRTAQDEDVVVCPNCDYELGTGDDSIRRQIWVSRSCGHVYCGLCTKQRAVSRAKRTDQIPRIKTKPFAKCVVPDCGKSVSQPKTMFQIYL